jgi:hypothetical protein
MSHVACRMLHVACCTSHVACCMLHVACYMLHVACYMLHVASGPLLLHGSPKAAHDTTKRKRRMLTTYAACVFVCSATLVHRRVSVDAFFVLAGSVLTSYVGVTGLVRHRSPCCISHVSRCISHASCCISHASRCISHASRCLRRRVRRRRAPHQKASVRAAVHASLLPATMPACAHARRCGRRFSNLQPPTCHWVLRVLTRTGPWSCVCVFSGGWQWTAASLKS